MGTKDKQMKTKKAKKNNENTMEEVVVTGSATSSRRNNGKKVITDARFSSVHSDPRFQNVPKQQSKITIDSRFERMFTDKNFSSSSARIDKRGKAKDQNSENSLPRYYNLEKEEELKKNKESKSDDEDETEEIEEDGNKLHKVHESDSETTDSEADDLKKPTDELESDHDTSSTNSDTDDEVDVYSDEELEEPEENIPLIEQETHRLAIVNMDWSQVRAVDLYVLMSSFLPKTGHVLSVAVYPSEFGLKRMEEEAVRGPIGIFEEKSDEDEGEDGDDNDEIDDAKLRAYEKSRLSHVDAFMWGQNWGKVRPTGELVKSCLRSVSGPISIFALLRYYYAVVECDSIATADYLYKTCDGTEFERSSNKLDLRFIPDSMEFKHPPRDVATEAPAKYEGLDFHTRALQHSKIHLTWDEDEPLRAKTLKRKFDADQLAELELKEFLASDDGESDEDGEDAEAADGQSEKKLDKWDKYRALIQAGDGSDEGEDEEDAKDMEVTFNTGLEDISKRILEKKDKESETVWEAYLRKKSEKKKARKNRSKNSSEDESSDSDREIPEEVDDFFLEEPSGKAGKTGKANRKEKQLEDVEKEQEASRAELELLLADDQDADHNVKGYNIKPKKAKGKKGKEVPSQDKIPVADYNDPRFSALFSSHLFALDPTDPQYKRSAAYARQMAQKHKNGVREETNNGEAQLQAADDTGPKKDLELQSDSISSKKNKLELSSLVRSIKNKSQQVKVLPVRKDPKKAKAVCQPITDSNNRDDELSSMIQSLKKKSRR